MWIWLTWGSCESADSYLVRLKPCIPRHCPCCCSTDHSLVLQANGISEVRRAKSEVRHIWALFLILYLKSQVNGLPFSSSLMFLIGLFSILMLFFFFFSSFDSKFIYQQRGLGPIEEDTILVIDPNNAAVLQSSGKNLWVKLLDYLSFSKEVVLNPDWILESPGTLPKIRLRFSLGAGPGIKIVVWKLPRWF